MAFAGCAAFPRVYILLTNPALHDGMRHMLFGVPPLVILMAVAIDKIATEIADQPTIVRNLAALALAGCISLQVFHLYRMHPYQYVSFNLLAGERQSLPQRYETEYWCTSSRHLLEALPRVIGVEDIPPAERPKIPIRVAGARDSALPFVPDGFFLVNSFEEADYYLSNTYLGADQYVEGEVIYAIERQGIPIGVIKRLGNNP